jgi:hypothetical protein
MKWNDELKLAPTCEPILVKVNNGIFGGGWTFHKALKVRDKFFNYDTKDEIPDVKAWMKVKI